MSKYQNTPSNKNKTQAEFNDSLYSNILSLISVILSVLSLVCAIWIGKIANEFATKISHLNYQLSVENPIASGSFSVLCTFVVFSFLLKSGIKSS